MYRHRRYLKNFINTFVNYLKRICCNYQTGLILLLARYYRLSVSLSVRDDVYNIVALRVSVGVESCTVVFLGRDFLFTSSETFAVECDASFRHRRLKKLTGTRSRLHFETVNK